jgi:hypothetical protein
MGAANDRAALYIAPDGPVDVAHVARDPCGRIALLPADRRELERAAERGPPALRFALDAAAEFVAFPGAPERADCRWCFLVDQRSGRRAAWEDRFLSRMLAALCDPERPVRGELNIGQHIARQSRVPYTPFNTAHPVIGGIDVYRISVRPYPPALHVGVRVLSDERYFVWELEGLHPMVSIEIGPVPGLSLVGYRALPYDGTDRLTFFLWDLRKRERGKPFNGMVIKPGVDILPALTETVGRAMSTCAVASVNADPAPSVHGTLFVGFAAPDFFSADTAARSGEAKRGEKKSRTAPTGVGRGVRSGER